jgi:hypothetical protein
MWMTIIWFITQYEALAYPSTTVKILHKRKRRKNQIILGGDSGKLDVLPKVLTKAKVATGLKCLY